jgi:hypothetical protein
MGGHRQNDSAMSQTSATVSAIASWLGIAATFEQAVRGAGQMVAARTGRDRARAR